MDDLIVLWQGHPQLSLRRFAQYASVPYWRLRDHQHNALARCAKQQHCDALYEKVRLAALQHPTSGYRMLYQELKSQGEQIGLHKIRVALGDLNLHHHSPGRPGNLHRRFPYPKTGPKVDGSRWTRLASPYQMGSVGSTSCWTSPLGWCWPAGWCGASRCTSPS